MSLPIPWSPRVSDSDNSWPMNLRLKAGARISVLDIDTISGMSGLNQIIAETNRQLQLINQPTLNDIILYKTTIDKLFFDTLITAIILVRGGTIDSATTITKILIKNLRDHLKIPIVQVILNDLHCWQTVSTDGITTVNILENNFFFNVSLRTLNPIIGGLGNAQRAYSSSFVVPTNDPNGNSLTLNGLTLNIGFVPGVPLDVYLIPGAVLGHDDFTFITSGILVGTFSYDNGLQPSSLTSILNLPWPAPGTYTIGIIQHNDLIAVDGVVYNINMTISYTY